MNNLMRAEGFKLRRDRSFRIQLGLLLLLGILYPILVVADSRSGEAAYTLTEFLKNTLSGVPILLQLVLPTLAGFFIGSEYTSGVMKSIASSGSSRLRIFTAKLVVLSAGGALLALSFILTSVIAYSFMAGFGGWDDSELWAYLLRAVLFTVLYASAFASITGLFTVILGDSGKSIGISLMFLLFIGSLLGFIGSRIPFVMTFYKHSPFIWVNMISRQHPTDGQFTEMVVVAVVTWLVLAVLGLLVFRRKEIK